MKTVNLPKPTSLEIELDQSDTAFGELRRSGDIIHDAAALRTRMAEDGYLYIPGLLDVDLVLAARQFIVDRLAESGQLDAQHPRMEAISSPNAYTTFDPKLLADNNEALQELLYTGAMMEFYERFLGGPVLHYDYTWLRAISGHSRGTHPHCDFVYMGRGTFNLYTSWVPLGDTPLEVGGLMILENSHRQKDKLRNYLERDVDVYCTNSPNAAEIEAGAQDWDGRLSSNPVTLREKLGGRWLTAEYKMGDVLVFTMGTVHASLDNHSNRFRLSSDSRYQLASEAVDERWIGANPIGHGPNSKKGKIC